MGEKTMTKEEKTLLIQTLLIDIRGNWGWDNGFNRAKLAKDLANELVGKVDGMNVLLEEIEMYDGSDGRYFRALYPNGYEGMDELHGLDIKTIKDKSLQFKQLAKKYLTHPEIRFDDWGEMEVV